jgi:hypothetical protein
MELELSETCQGFEEYLAPACGPVKWAGPVNTLKSKGKVNLWLTAVFEKYRCHADLLPSLPHSASVSLAGGKKSGRVPFRALSMRWGLAFCNGFNPKTPGSVTP